MNAHGLLQELKGVPVYKDIFTVSDLFRGCYNVDQIPNQGTTPGSNSASKRTSVPAEHLVRKFFAQ